MTKIRSEIVLFAFQINVWGYPVKNGITGYKIHRKGT
jgi:hypothetical protein